MERVLTHLSGKELFFAQHVCKQWRGVIEKSTELQKKLFNKPEAPCRWLCELRDSDHYFRLCKAPADVARGPRTPWSQILNLRCLNPMVLGPHCEPERIISTIFCVGEYLLQSMIALRRDMLPSRAQYLQDLDSAYFSMQLAQPPLKKVNVLRQSLVITASQNKMIVRKDGVRMLDVLQVIWTLEESIEESNTVDRPFGFLLLFERCLVVHEAELDVVEKNEDKWIWRNTKGQWLVEGGSKKERMRQEAEMPAN